MIRYADPSALARALLRRCAIAKVVELVPTVEVQPLFRLRRPDTTIVSIAWGGHDTIAAGCTDGESWRSGATPEPD